jgi:hypothetical protein
MFWKDFILGIVFIVVGLVIMWKNYPHLMSNVGYLGFISLFIGMILIFTAIINNFN